VDEGMAMTGTAAHRSIGRRAVAVTATLCFCVTSAVALVAPTAAVATPTPGRLSFRPGTFAVQEVNFTEYDPTRWTPARTHAPAHPGRSIKTFVYVPKGATWPMPTIIFGPGAYVQPTFDEVMLRAWASAGYLVIGLDFPGSTAPNATGSILSRDLQNNAADMSFTYTWLQQHKPWSQMVDFSKVAAAGHSDGAIEVAALALHSGFADPRFAAFLELSGGTDASFGCCYAARNTAPLFASAGTKDDFGAYAPTVNTWGIAASPKTLVRIAGADHWRVYTLFYGPQSDAIRTTTVDWLNTALRHDPNAIPNFTYDATHNGLSYETATSNSVDATWSVLGGQRSPLGAATSAVGADARRYATVGYFQGGAIYLIPGIGTRVVWGDIWARYQAIGSVTSRLGYPTANEQELTRTGHYQSFQAGWIAWSPSTGAHVVDGQILSAWRARGAADGSLGYPTGEIRSTSGGGRTATFQGGALYWSPTTGSQVVNGAAMLIYASLGWDHGWLGLPLASTTGAGSAQITQFANGAILSTSSRNVTLTRPVADRYLMAGSVTGPLGLPVGSTTTSGTTQTSAFQNGSIVVNTAAGTVTESVYGRAARTTSSDSIRSWADRAYLEVLGRHVDASGGTYTTSLVRRGVTPLNVAAGLASSHESHVRTASAIYQQILGRTPDAAGLAWAAGLLDRGYRPIDLSSLLGSSAEFWHSAGSTNAGFVQLIYQRVLGRAADPGGLSYWTSLLASGTPRKSLIVALVSSPEVAHNAVRGAYLSVLGRPADAAGLLFWSTWWTGNGGDTAGVVARLTGSVEFTDLG
jgi:hypothetical protein